MRYFLFLFFDCLFFPYYLGDAEDFKEANPLVTSPHIKPELYFFRWILHYCIRCGNYM